MNPFDQAAATYDADFTHTPTGRLQRQRVYHFLKPFLLQPCNILEINCGTGEDACWLATQGHHVTATDGSEEMIRIASEKLPEAGKQAGVTFRKIDFHSLRHSFPAGSFTTIFSDFGGLNCIDPGSLKLLLEDLYALLQPGGLMIAVIMGRKCLWEKLFFLWRGDLKKANRRMSPEAIEAAIGPSKQHTWYYSPQEIRTLSYPFFIVRTVKPVGLFLPPSYLDPFFLKRQGLLSWLNGLEEKLACRYFADYGDHYFIALKKRPA